MEQYLHWVVGVMLAIIGASFKYTSMVAEKLDALSEFVHSLPCVSVDVEKKLDALEKRMDKYDEYEVKDAIGFHREGTNDDDDTDTD
jgi:hypothetical protein